MRFGRRKSRRQICKSGSGDDPIEGGEPNSTETPGEEVARPHSINVFVHLARDKDARNWRQARAAGNLVGFNDETPYGYHRAERMGCRVAFSRSNPEIAPIKFARLAIRALTGFDLVHALRQKTAIGEADIVWTHTESQYLAVAATLLLTGARSKVLGQSVWLMDRWASLGFLHRALYSRLISRVELLTFHSPANLALARASFPNKKMALVRFGIPTERTIAPRMRPASPFHILALGNDRDRDWATLIAAVRNSPEFSLLIHSGSVSAKLSRGAANVEIRPARTQAELVQSFEQAAVVCVPLRPNFHASGITVIQEAVLAGVPVVATDTGGLDAYFMRDEVRFVAPGDVEQLREALLATARDPEAACNQARRAQARMIEGEISAEAYIRQHVELSQEILQR
jgi:glycosyltransferase involved in cell wall biosynthesis